MTTNITRLSNGLTVVTHAMPHLETVSLGVWVSCGARDESLAEHGISHFIEHMAFKGTERRSARAIAEEIEVTFPGYQPISPEVGLTVVPDVEAGGKSFGEATIFTCLFSDNW